MIHVHAELGTGTDVRLDADSVKRAQDWSPILLALRRNAHARRIRVLSDGPAEHSKVTGHRRTARIPPIIHTNLRVQKYLARSSGGIAQAQSLQRLSLARSSMGDQGLFALSKSLRQLRGLHTLNVSGCNLTPAGAAVLADVITSRAVRRQAAVWECTLRVPLKTRSGRRTRTRMAERDPTPAHSEGLPRCIERLTACHNVFGDDGVHLIVEALVEEVGLLALDLQYNDVTDVGAGIVLQVLHLNRELRIVDLRNNSVDAQLWTDITTLIAPRITSTETATTLSNNSADPTPQNPNPSQESNLSSAAPPSSLSSTTIRWLDARNPLRDTYPRPLPSRSAPHPRPRGSGPNTGTHNQTDHHNHYMLASRPPFKVGPAPGRAHGNGTTATTTTSTSVCPATRASSSHANRAKPRAWEDVSVPRAARRDDAGYGNDHDDGYDVGRPDLIRQNAMLRRRLIDLEDALSRGVTRPHPYPPSPPSREEQGHVESGHRQEANQPYDDKDEDH
ncbi:Centrosomal protein of 78 kDa [Thoreauomyces humboldtii]|nr:Centrosomal protein of 78 kDa [Thoreauomyces humboldtii]